MLALRKNDIRAFFVALKSSGASQSDAGNPDSSSRKRHTSAGPKNNCLHQPPTARRG